jgi:dihydrofolate reductase
MGSAPTGAVLAAVVAMDEGRVIGFENGLPWRLPEDMAHFKALTSGGIVLMGRKTWESLPLKFRPLPNRVNIVVSRTPDQLQLPAGVLSAGAPDEALELARGQAGSGQRIWVIGGAAVYRAFMPLLEEIHLTLVRGVHQGDATFPPFEADFRLVSERPTDRCIFRVYRRSGGAETD